MDQRDKLARNIQTPVKTHNEYSKNGTQVFSSSTTKATATNEDFPTGVRCTLITITSESYLKHLDYGGLVDIHDYISMTCKPIKICRMPTRNPRPATTKLNNHPSTYSKTCNRKYKSSSGKTHFRTPAMLNAIPLTIVGVTCTSEERSVDRARWVEGA